MKEIEKLLRAGVPAEELVKEIEEARARIELEKNSAKAKENIKAKLEKNLISYLSIDRTEPIPEEIINYILKDFDLYLKSCKTYLLLQEKKIKRNPTVEDNELNKFLEWLDGFAK